MLVVSEWEPCWSVEHICKVRLGQRHLFHAAEVARRIVKWKLTPRVQVIHERVLNSRSYIHLCNSSPLIIVQLLLMIPEYLWKTREVVLKLLFANGLPWYRCWLFLLDLLLGLRSTIITFTIVTYRLSSLLWLLINSSLNISFILFPIIVIIICNSWWAPVLIVAVCISMIDNALLTFTDPLCLLSLSRFLKCLSAFDHSFNVLRTYHNGDIDMTAFPLKDILLLLSSWKTKLLSQYFIE